MKNAIELLDTLFVNAVDYLRAATDCPESVAALLLARERGEVVDLTGLLQAAQTMGLMDIVTRMKTDIFISLSGQQGMGQNALQSLTRHSPDDIGLLLPLLNLLEPDHLGALFTQKNAKNVNLLGLTVYYASTTALPHWLPLAQKLSAFCREELLRQRLSGWHLPRFVACVCPTHLPAIFSLMDGLTCDVIAELLGEQDNHGFTLLHYVTMYCPGVLSSLLAVINRLESGLAANLLDKTNTQSKTALMDAVEQENPDSVRELLKAVSRLEPADQFAVLARKDPWGNTLIMKALQSRMGHAGIVLQAILELKNDNSMILLTHTNRRKQSVLHIAEACHNQDVSDRIRAVLQGHAASSSSTGFFSKKTSNTEHQTERSCLPHRSGLIVPNGA